MSESKGLTLPPGWELENGATDVPSPGQQSTEGYGGATMNWALDGAQVWFLGCCAKKDGGPLYFSIFKLQNNALVNVPLSGAGTGRGWLDVASDGWMYWSSWEGSSIRPYGPPARVPDAVRASSGSSGGAGVPIPAGGAISQLYTGVYVAADFDTPQETATRVQKQLDAIDELIVLLKTAGVLI